MNIVKKNWDKTQIVDSNQILGYLVRVRAKKWGNLLLHKWERISAGLFTSKARNGVKYNVYEKHELVVVVVKRQDEVDDEGRGAFLLFLSPFRNLCFAALLETRESYSL